MASWRGQVNGILERSGYRITNVKHGRGDIERDVDFKGIRRFCQPYTMTSVERMYALFQTVGYIANSDIVGAFVECGVWRGGSCMLMAETLTRMRATPRDIYLYDLFGAPDAGGDHYWAERSLSEVEGNLRRTQYPPERFKPVVGDITQSVKFCFPASISLLRLDLDAYEPTRAAFALYERVQPGGVVIVDDYGSHPDGAGRATEEVLSGSPPVLLHRIDAGGRTWVKP